MNSSRYLLPAVGITVIIFSLLPARMATATSSAVTSCLLNYGMFLVFFILLLLAVLLFMYFSMRKKFNAKTVELELAVESLKKSEGEYRAILENANSFILKLNPAGTITYINVLAENFFGWKKGETIGKHLIGAVFPETESTDRNLREMIDTVTANQEGLISNINENMRKNGERVWVSWANTPIYDKAGNLSEILSIGTDITPQKLAQESCQEKEARFRALSNSSPDIVYTMDRTGTINYVNPAWKKILGHEKEEVLGHYFTDFAKESDRKIYRKLFKNIRDDAKEVNNFIGVMLAKDGTERTFNMYGTFILDTQGKPLGIVSSLKDFSEYQEMERKLNHAQRLESIGTLAGGIAHDFNNLLMGIQGYTSLMLMDTSTSDPNHTRLKRIEEQVEKGANLTKQLLGFAREGRYEQRPNNLNKIIGETSSLFGRTKKDISIDLLLDPNLPEAEVDRGQMEQMFMNLFVNAGQAMPDGGNICIKTVQVSIDEKKAKINEIEKGNYIRISIQDSGIGMDKKTMERIFDTFFTTQRQGRGTGLGLATVYGIVRGHKGMIEVESEPGSGTTFSIYLPAIEKKPETENKPETKKVQGIRTVLLADDENTVRETTAELISMLGYRVFSVGSGQAAIATFLEKRAEIDLVVLDMIMPGISGAATFDRLREIDPDIRVLLSSGYSINSQAKAIMERGCKGFIQKPFKIEELSIKIKEALES